MLTSGGRVTCRTGVQFRRYMECVRTCGHVVTFPCPYTARSCSGVTATLHKGLIVCTAIPHTT